MPIVGRTMESECPSCGAHLDGFTNTSGTSAPQPGDPSICVYCLALIVFDTDGDLRLPTKDELRRFMADEGVRAAIHALEVGRT